MKENDDDSRSGDAPRPRVELPAPPAPAIPPGTPVAHLKSAAYGTFVYRRMVDRVEGGPADGDIVAVADKTGRFFGWAFWHGLSQLALRMISRGGPMPDGRLLAGRITAAVALRHDVLQLPQTTDAYRLVHAEGDGLSGLVADRFGEYVVIELFSLAMFRRIEALKDALIDAGRPLGGPFGPGLPRERPRRRPPCAGRLARGRLPQGRPGAGAVGRAYLHANPPDRDGSACRYARPTRGNCGRRGSGRRGRCRRPGGAARRSRSSSG